MINNLMKKSEELRQQLAEEDNDLKAMGLMNKVLRERREEKFEETWLPKIKSNFDCIDELSTKGKLIILSTFYGKLDYYPKANKVLIRNKNKWVKPGLKWLVTKLNL
jgi:hypothetical protein